LGDNVEDGFRGLQVAIVWDDPPDLIELQVRAGNGRFGGDIRAYAAPDAVHALADALDGFPRDSTDVREFSLGTFGPDTAGGAASFRFACTDRAGHAAVNLRLESGESPNQPETACFSFEFEPAALDRFVRELRELIPRREHAVLPAA
jgi:hypothetical protein